MLVYISGKITGTNDFRERFEKIEEFLTNKGYSCINPVKVADSLPELEYNLIMAICLTLVTIADAMYAPKDYRLSNGASLEMECAKRLGKVIMYEEDWDECRRADANKYN